MVAHFIDVTFVNPGTIQAPPNQHLLEVDGGDTVTWNFSPGGQRLEIAFLSFMPADGSDHLIRQSPFSSSLSPGVQTIGPGIISGAPGLYNYKVTNNGLRLDWNADLFTLGSFRANFGGIIIRDPD